jgi:flagellar biosynthesis/type III secretory pathway protein FliH
MNAQAGKLISRWHAGSFEKGEAEGIAKGKAEGIAKGKAEGIAKGIIAVLEARGLTMTDAQRERVLGSTDLNQLDRWLRRAATVSDPAALFE